MSWINMSRNIRCEMNITGDPYALQPDMELMLIRIAQEAIQNTLKHSRAESMTLNIAYAETQFSMQVEDDEIGFEINPEAPWKGLGLQSIYERSRIINGDIEINSVAGKGTVIKLLLNHPKNIKLPDLFIRLDT